MKNKNLQKLIVSLGAMVCTFLLIFFQAFYGLDKLVADALFQTGGPTNHHIHIIAIDDKTLDAYGSFSMWSREKSAQLLQFLNQDKEQAPAVITFDILYTEEGDPAQDEKLAQAAALNDNVVMGMNVQFKEIPKRDENGRIYYDLYNVDAMDMPIAGLKENVTPAFVNTISGKDGYVRQGIRKISNEGQTYNSLAYETYARYQDSVGAEKYEPKVDESQLYSFSFTDKSGGFDVVSLCDVLDGKFPQGYFAGDIVLVGAYALGMQDSYAPAIAHGEQMNGVEIHANIINALFNEATQISAGRGKMAIISALIAFVACMLFHYLKILPAGAVGLLMVGAYVFAVKFVYNRGYIMPLLVLPAVLVLIYVEAVVEGYVEEIKRRRKIVGVFKQYMAPQIVDEISKQKDFSISLGGRKRHIACLFVDIRGFTTMSEILDPAQVVEILNEYLSLTTQSIFDNNGTLDKFVGDCTMAVFNSPIDLDDYIFRAVNAAWAMKVGSEPLSKKLEERFGRTVHFGIGVNCGDAVVGNIGCDFRMDYTAIGDTVNTAARLEANAKASQILISQAVYDAVKDRVKVTPIGEIPLKGKSVGVFVYQVDDVNPNGFGEEQA